MRTSNPALNNNSFRKYGNQAVGNQMTIDGTVNKTFILLILTLFSAGIIWNNIEPLIQSGYLYGIIIGSVIIGLIIALITIFKKEWSPVTAPIYVVIEGIILGSISVMLETIYPGIVIQAVALTFGTALSLLFIYKARIIKVTENFRMGIFAATGAIMLIYLASFVMSFFGTTIPYIHENGLIGIIFSLIVVVIAALNLVLDFDFIENAAKQKVPKFMEWYAAFGLMVTLIWLYIEILRLLTKLRSRS